MCWWKDPPIEGFLWRARTRWLSFPGPPRLLPTIDTRRLCQLDALRTRFVSARAARRAQVFAPRLGATPVLGVGSRARFIVGTGGRRRCARIRARMGMMGAFFCWAAKAALDAAGRYLAPGRPPGCAVQQPLPVYEHTPPGGVFALRLLHRLADLPRERKRLDLSGEFLTRRRSGRSDPRLRAASSRCSLAPNLALR